jgi:hypothetical protein
MTRLVYRFILTVAVALAPYDAQVGTMLGATASGSALAAPSPSAAQIPAIGCPTQGQIVLVAPRNSVRSLPLDTRLAGRLAWYGDAVLAPLGWHCIRLVSDSGISVLVTQAPFPRSPFERQITGPRVVLADVDSGAYGRYFVAQDGARYFPRLRSFAEGVMGEGFWPRSDFIFHPYRADRFVTRHADLVEVETPPFARGYGTRGLPGDALPVRSRIRLFYDRQEPELRVVIVKLTPALRDLLPIILDTTDQSLKP